MWKALFTEIFVPQTITWVQERPSFKGIFHDLLAGLSMGAFCFPLAVAFAIATGVEPIRGLYTAIIAGFLTALFSGSRVQIGGPAGSLAVVSLLIVQKHGVDGLMVATLLAGILLVFFGITRLGSLIKYIPDTVTIAYSTGIALVIFSSQIHDLFGLTLSRNASHFGEKWIIFFEALPTFHLASFFIGMISLAVLICCRIWIPRFPGSILALLLGGLIVCGLDLDVETLGSRFGALSNSLPTASWPPFSLAKAKLVFHDSVMLAVLIAIESTIAAVVTSGMVGQRARHDCELIAQGLSNLASIFFGGIPSSGSLSRGSTSVRYGARSPLAGMVHALFIAVLLSAVAPLMQYIPAASVAAVLMMLGWNMLDLKPFLKFFRAPRTDVIVFALVFFLILFVDITVGVEVGIVLSTSLFIKRMSEHEHAIRFSDIFADPSGNLLDPDCIDASRVPPGVEVLEINGPFFYGIVERFKEMMDKLGPSPTLFILRMRKVPFIDATAMRAIDDLQEKCLLQNKRLLLSGVTPAMRAELKRVGIEQKIGSENIFPHIDAALCHLRLLQQPAPIEPLVPSETLFDLS